MRLKSHKLVAALAVIALTGIVSLVQPVGTAQADPTVPFTVKFTANANGAIITIGNNLLTCPAGSVSTTVAAVPCAAARAGAAVNNNSYNMTYLDADAVASTFNSSSSQLNLPPGASVLWAGLYWGARLTAGTGGTSSPASGINQMSLRAPGDAVYRTIAASAAPRDQFGPNTASYSAYQRFANVTAIVRAAGNGDYWGANVVTGTGADRYAGWALVVAYTAPDLPLRNLTVFDGFSLVQSIAPQTITISGFKAPLAGVVGTQLTMVAYEGDLAQSGDYASLNGMQLATAASPGSNFFNSANALNGTTVTTRTPADVNMLGFDIKNLGASGAIPNGATSAQFLFSSTGDTYYPGVLGLAINLYAPDFTASSKSVVNLSGNVPPRPGDTLQYTVSYANTGQDPAVSVVSRDTLPPGTNYVPGSLVLIDPATYLPTPLTDAPDTDVGRYDPVTRTVTVNLGGGATGTQGGRMDWSSTTHPGDGTAAAIYSFKVTLAPTSTGTTVSNTATLDYQTETTGIAATYTTNQAITEVPSLADVQITKQLTPSPALAGDLVTATLTVKNNGPDTATGVVVTDQIPAGWLNPTVTSPASLCDIAAGRLTCNLGNLANGAQVVVVFTGRTPPNSAATSLINVATVTTTALDPVPGNNVASDTVPLNQQADLQVTKVASPTSAAPGSPVTWTLTVKNNGPSDATAARLVDALDDASLAMITSAVLDATTTAAGGNCLNPTFRAINCALGTLPAGATATVTVQGVLGAAISAGIAVGDTARVSSDTPDPNAANNTATAIVTTTAPSADVRVTMDGPVTVVAGTPITWTATATNYGPSDAADVVIQDVVNGNVSNLKVTTTRGTCTVTGSEIACTIDTLHSSGSGDTVPGDTVIITITGDVAPNATGTLPNTAYYRPSTTPDPVSTNNGQSVTTTIQTLFDLSVTKTANRQSLPSSGPVDYTIVVKNNGPSTARNVMVTDLVPTALDFVSVSPTSCTSPAATADPDHNSITCVLTTAIPPGGTQTVVVHMMANTDLAAIGTPVTETVSVRAVIGDDQTKLDDNTAIWVLSGAPQIDLALAKQAPATSPAGGMLTYSLTVTNNQQPSDPSFTTTDLTAQAPTVTDTLPAGVTLVPNGTTVDGVASATPTWCSAAGSVVTCTLPDEIGPGESQAFGLSVLVAPATPAGTVLTNTALVTPTGTIVDPAPLNNTATAATTIDVATDVGVENFTVAPPAGATYTGPGSQRDVSFDVVNNGPSTATQVQFRITRGVDAVANPPAGATCTATVRSLLCTLPADLAPGARVPISYTITLPGNVTPGVYPDAVAVSSATPETNMANNTADAQITVDTATTALTVTKQALGTVTNPNAPADQAFVAGGAFAYQVSVQVTGDLADATGVTLTDTMPAGFIPQRVDTSSGTCSIAGGAISCNLGTVASGAGEATPPVAVVTVRGVLAAGAVALHTTNAWAENVSNQADVTTETPLSGVVPPAVALVDVIEQTDLQLLKMPDDAVVNAGGVAGYTLTVVNNGPSDATHVLVTDTLPAGLTYDPVLSQCDAPMTSPVDETLATPQQPAGAIMCRIPAIAAGASASIHLVAQSGYTMTAGTVTNRATVGSLGDDPSLANNQATADIEIARLTDLAISSSVSTTTPVAGQDITFTGYAMNNGPSSANGTTGETTFPVGFVPVSYLVENNDCQWSPAAPANPMAEPWRNVAYTLTCVPSVPGAAWEPGGAATNIVVMHIPDDTPAGNYFGTSSITSTTPETELDNNSTTQELYVQRVSDTYVTKTLETPEDELVGGQPATWRLDVGNDGPSVAQYLEISDAVPAGMTYSSARVDGGGTCPAPQSEGGVVVVRCTMDQLAVGASGTIYVTLKVKSSGGEVCNTGFVGSGSLDPVAANNQSQVCGLAEPGPPGVEAPTGGSVNSTGALAAAWAMMAIGIVWVLWRKNWPALSRRRLS